MKRDRWTSDVEGLTRDFVTRFGTLSPQQLNWKPDPATWSIAQNLDHLITVNSSYFPILENLQANTYQVPFTGKIDFLVNYLGNFILRSVQPDRKKRMKTFAVWEPSTTTLPDDIMRKFQDHQNVLKSKISTHADLIHRNPVISSPANRYIVYRLQTAIDIIIAHEKRHYEQAAELLPHVPG